MNQRDLFFLGLRLLGAWLLISLVVSFASGIGFGVYGFFTHHAADTIPGAVGAAIGASWIGTLAQAVAAWYLLRRGEALARIAGFGRQTSAP